MLSQLLDNISNGRTGSMATDSFLIDVIDDSGALSIKVTDRATGSIATSEAWKLGDLADVDASAVWKEYEPAGDEAKRSVVTAARQTLTTRLLRTVRLGGQFELRVNQVIDPLWKPNWLYTDKNKRVQILVDGLNGSTGKRRL